MVGLDLFLARGLFKLEVGQAQLDLELRLNQVLPGLAFLDVAGFNLQGA
jgi:hypothetical protein